MAITHTWTISSLDVAPSEDALTDVIKTVHWRYRATDSADGLVAETYSSQAFVSPDPASYTPFEDVTEAQLTGWIADAIGEDAMDAMDTRLAEDLDRQRNPPIVAMQPPWLA